MSYKILEYIQSSGTQYIDTGLKADTIGRIQMEFKIANLGTTSSWRTFMGAEINSPYNTLGIRLTSGNIFAMNYGSGSSASFADIVPTADVLYTTDLNGIAGTATWNDTTLTIGNTGTIANKNAYLFGINGNDSFSQGMNMKLYSCKIYNTSGDLVRDYIPVDFNGVACLYDQTRQYLQRNNGSGSFVKGPETGEEIETDHLPSSAHGTYRVVKYLQNSGQQSIDTCYKPNNNTRIRAKVNHQDNSATYRNWFGTWGGQSMSTGKMFGLQIGTSTGGTLYYGSSRTSYTFDIGMYTLDFNKNNWYLNGTNYSMSSSTFQSEYNMYLFGVCGYGGEPSSVEANFQIYYFDIYENNNLVRSYVPVLDENDRPCMYDKVHQEVYYNFRDTDTDFIAGDLTGEVITPYVEPTVSEENEYAILEFLESTGLQYIDTRILPNANIHCVVDFRYSNIATSGIIGGWDAKAGMLFGVNGSNFQFAFGTNAWAGSTTVADNNRHIVYMNDDNGDGRLDDTVLASHSAVVSLTNTSKTLLLFSSNGGTGISSAKIYSCEIYDKDKLIKHFVPAKNYSGEYGMLDLVTNIFYKNRGASTFLGSAKVRTYHVPAFQLPTHNFYIGEADKARKIVKGYVSVDGEIREVYKGYCGVNGKARIMYTSPTIANRYEPYEYVQSFGTQEINTGYYPTANTRIVADAQFTSRTNQQRLCGVADGSRLVLHVYINGATQWAFACQDNVGNWQTTSTNADTNRHTFELKNINGERQEFYLDGVLKTTTTVLAVNNSTTPLYLMSNRGTQYGNLKIYNFKIYEGDVLVHDFVPVEEWSTGRAGFFDNVTKDFYYDHDTPGLLARPEKLLTEDSERLWTENDEEMEAE